MPNLRSILASLGIGGAELEIVVDGDEHPRGAPVFGKVILSGGIAPERIELLYLVVFQFDGRRSSSMLDLHLARRFEIGPYQRLEFPFDFQMPHNMGLSREPFLGRSGCFLKATAAVGWAVDPRASLSVTVTEHREISAVKAAMRMIGFVEKWKMHALDPAQHVSRQDYTAGRDLHQWLNGASLEIYSNGLTVEGKLVLYKRDYTLADRLSGQDKVTCVVQIPCNELIDKRGLPNIKAATAHINQLLTETMLMPDDLRNVLLRPSGAPTAPDSLLRPATSTAAPSDNLLHPSQPSL